MSSSIVRVEADRPTRGLEGRVILAGPKLGRGQVQSVNERIELVRADMKRDGLVVSFQGRTQPSIQVVGVRISRRQLEGALECLLRADPIEIAGELDEAERAVRRAELIVQLE